MFRIKVKVVTICTVVQSKRTFNQKIHKNISGEKFPGTFSQRSVIPLKV